MAADPTRVDGAGTERPVVTWSYWDVEAIATFLDEHESSEWAEIVRTMDNDLDAARDDARLGRALRRLFNREGLAVLAAPWDEPGVRITGCGTVVAGETLEAAVAALEGVLEGATG